MKKFISFLMSMLMVLGLFSTAHAAQPLSVQYDYSLTRVKSATKIVDSNIPNQSYNILANVKEDDYLVIVDYSTDGQWASILMGDGSIGYINTSAIDLAVKTDQTNVVMCSANVNAMVYQDAGRQTREGTLRKNTAVPVLDVYNNGNVQMFRIQTIRGDYWVTAKNITNTGYYAIPTLVGVDIFKTIIQNDIGSVRHTIEKNVLGEELHTFSFPTAVSAKSALTQAKLIGGHYVSINASYDEIEQITFQEIERSYFLYDSTLVVYAGTNYDVLINLKGEYGTRKYKSIPLTKITAGNIQITKTNVISKPTDLFPGQTVSFLSTGERFVLYTFTTNAKAITFQTQITNAFKTNTYVSIGSSKGETEEFAVSAYYAYFRDNNRVVMFDGKSKAGMEYLKSKYGTPFYTAKK